MDSGVCYPGASSSTPYRRLVAAEPPTRHGRTQLIAALITLLVALYVIWEWPNPVTARVPAAVRPHGVFSWLRVAHGAIVDGQGRTVTLRGFNVDALTDPRDHELGTPAPLDARDAELMQESGFDCVRLPIAWSLLEPQRGRFSTAYLNRISALVRLLEAHRLRVIIDMHFGKAWGPAADVPAWATLSWAPDWSPTANSQWHDALMVRNLTSYTAFWLTNGWQQQLALAWQQVARRFRDDPGVVGYDLYNEPHPLPIPPGAFGSRFLFPLYARLISAIGKVDPNHLFFLDSTLFAGLPTNVDRVRAQDVVYAPHLYVGSLIRMPTSLIPEALHLEVGMRSDESRAVGGALWFSEVGVDHDAPNSAHLMQAYLDDMDAQQAGWSWWQWRQNGGWGIRNVAGNHINWRALRELAQPYLEAAPSGVRAEGSDGHRMTIGVAADHASAAAMVAWPVLLAGTPHAAGQCLASSSWDVATARLMLRFAAHAKCLVRVQ